jgi:hypothetical protein
MVCPAKPNPNPCHIRDSSAKARPNKTRENPWISLAESGLFKELRPIQIKNVTPKQGESPEQQFCGK